MLARKYDNYAWEEQQYEEQVQPQQLKKINSAPFKGLRQFAMLTICIFLATYFVVVLRSFAMTNLAQELITMRQEETMLINKNSELKIEVEQLKGPERIIGLAEQNLGMQVARSNIYVKALDVKNKTNSLAVAAK